MPGTRNRSIRVRAALGLIVGIGLVLAGCSSASKSTNSAGSPSSLVVNDSTAPSSLDPVEEANLSDPIIDYSVYTTLIQYGTKPAADHTLTADYGKIEPYLAKSWTISPNGLVYTFQLNHNFRFSDGTPITAPAVVFSFERAIKLNASGAYVVLDGHYSPSLFKSITAQGDWTVVMTLNFPDPEVLDDWAQSDASIVEPSVVDAHGGVVANSINTWMESHIAGGGGAFVLQSYQPGVSAILVANPKSPIQPETHQITVNFISSTATLGLDARSQEADITLGLPDSTVHSLNSASGVRVVSYPTASSEQLGFNTRVAPTNNLDLRTALEYAVPYQSILKTVAFGYGGLFKGEWFPDMAAYDRSVQGSPFPYDLSRAKALLGKSGLKLPVHFPVVIESGDTAAADIAPILQSIWSQIGVDISIDTLSPTVYVNDIESHKDSAYIRLSGPGVPAAAYYVGYDMVCNVGPNVTQTCIPQLDSLLDKAQQLPASQQQAYWNQIDQLIINYSPKIQLFDDYAAVVFSSKVKSFEYTTEFGGMRYWS